MNKLILLILFTALHSSLQAQKNTLLIEAESFTNKGGWVVNQKFIEEEKNSKSNWIKS